MCRFVTVSKNGTVDEVVCRNGTLWVCV